MKRLTVLLISIVITVFIVVSSCSKTDFLNEKPQKSLLIPSTLDDFQAILDADDILNGTHQGGVTPQLGESRSDNFYVLDQNFDTDLQPQMQNYYIWEENPYVGMNVDDYLWPYRAILYTNTVLEEISSAKHTAQENDRYNSLVGQALFHRAHMFYHLAQVFAPVYDKRTDSHDRGIILRLSADINEHLTRATVGETYNQILTDLRASVALLDDSPVFKTRPSKQAAYGLLARTYLAMGEYEFAKYYADSCLYIQNDLLDFNLVNAGLVSPFQGPAFAHPVNREIVFFSAMLSAVSQGFPTSYSHALVDSSLYSSYHIDDLRRTVFFNPRGNGYRFKGTFSFNAATHYFSGIAVDEILLIRAECNARLGNVEAAMGDLNRLIRSRWRAGANYDPYSTQDKSEALSIILMERRKELLYRGLRWTDLRRLNKEGANISLSRMIKGKIYKLPANDQRWTLQLPPDVLIP